jgi:hypothetical protein
LRGSPLKTPVLLIGGVLATILLGLFALTVYECCSNFDASHKDLVRLAESYLAKGDEANAVSVLERSLLEEKRPKQEQRQILLDRALFALAAKMVRLKVSIATPSPAIPAFRLVLSTTMKC